MSSMPVSYQNSDLLRCRVSFNYDRYIVETNSQSRESEPGQTTPIGIPNPGFPSQLPSEFDNSQFEVNPNINLSIPPLSTPRIGTQPGQVNPGSGGIVPPSNETPEDLTLF